jgi:hypothetical protein
MEVEKPQGAEVVPSHPAVVHSATLLAAMETQLRAQVVQLGTVSTKIAAALVAVPCTQPSPNPDTLMCLGLRASPATSPARPLAAVFFIRTAKNGPVAPPVPRFPPDLGLNPSGEPRPSPIPRGALGDSGREKSGNGPALSAREHVNPTIWTQIPLFLPSLLCRRRHHPSPIRRTVA